MTHHPLRALALACALAAMPACATAPVANPVAVAQTADQRAYALLASYAAVLETASVLVRDPALPTAAKRALIRAEAIATPAAYAVRTAFVAYLRARAAYEATDAEHSDRAAANIALAAQRLNEALTAAEAPVATFAQLTAR